MKELTPEQTEAAIILKSLWDRAKAERKFTQSEASKEIGITQPNISGFLNKKTPLGPVSVAKFAKFLGVKPSVIMPALAYLDQTADEIVSTEDSEEAKNYAPLLSVEDAKKWIAGTLDYRDIQEWETRIPLFDHWAGRRCFAMMASQQDAAANNFIKFGDIVLCDPTRRPGAGELAYYEINGDWVLGLLQRHAGKWILTFSAFDPITIEDEDAMRVTAVVAYYGVFDPELRKALHLS